MFEYRELEEPQPFTDAEQKAIDDLKQLFNENTDINFQTDNFFLTKFLRYRDWNAQAAYESIVKYYELKHNNPTVHVSQHLSEYVDILNLNTRVVLDKRDKDGRIVVVAKLGNIGENTQFNDASLVDDIYMQVLLSDPLTQINGVSIIADCTGLSSAILKWVIPKNCRVGAAKLESLPIKNWTIHVVNMGPILRTCIMLIKPFLRKATIARFQFHSSGYSDMIDTLGEDCVPDEYGGNNGPIDYEKSLKFIMSRDKLLARNREFGYKH